MAPATAGAIPVPGGNRCHAGDPMIHDLRAEIRRAQRMKGDGPLVVATIDPGHVDHWFYDSMLKLWSSKVWVDRINRPGGGRISMISSPRIAEARSQIVETFLTEPIYEQAEWLLTIDTDMTFDPEDVQKLLDAADVDEGRRILGGLCFAGRTPANMYPTIYRATRDEHGGLILDRHNTWPDNALLEVSATGAAFVLIHRLVLLEMRKAFAFMPGPAGTPIKNPYPWYAEGQVDHEGRPIGEDVVFCLKAQACGHSTYIHTGTNIGHVKQIELNRALWESNHAATAPDVEPPVQHRS